MRRLAPAAALGGLLALPAPLAYACTQAPPQIEVDRERALAGATVRVSGTQIHHEDGSGAYPGDEIMRPPSPTPVEATATAEPARPSDSPLVSLPPLRSIDAVPVAYAPAPPSTLVTVAITPYASYDWFAEPETRAGQVLDQVPPNAPRKWRDDWYRHSFAATGTLPTGLRPGRYVLSAYQQVGVHFGYDEIAVVDSRGWACLGSDAVCWY